MRSIGVHGDRRTLLIEVVLFGLFALSVVIFPGPLNVFGEAVGRVLALAFFGLWTAYSAKLYFGGRLG